MNKPLPIVLSKFAKTFLKGAVLFMVLITLGVVIGTGAVKAEAEPTYQRPAWCANGFACMDEDQIYELFDEAFNQGSEHAFQKGRSDIIHWVIARCSKEELTPFWMDTQDTGKVYFQCMLKPEVKSEPEPEGTWL